MNFFFACDVLVLNYAVSSFPTSANKCEKYFVEGWLFTKDSEFRSSLLSSFVCCSYQKILHNHPLLYPR